MKAPENRPPYESKSEPLSDRAAFLYEDAVIFRFSKGPDLSENKAMRGEGPLPESPVRAQHLYFVRAPVNRREYGHNTPVPSDMKVVRLPAFGMCPKMRRTFPALRRWRRPV